MRRQVAERNPGLVSLNDQAHVSNLLIGDLCKEGWVKGVIQWALVVSSYVRGHQRLLAAYNLEKSLYNQTLSSEAASEKRTAVAYLTPSTTRFLYHRDLLSACVRNRPAPRNLLERNNGSELQCLVRPRDASAQDAQATFLSVAESAADARDWVAVHSMLDPVCEYLRLFDGRSAASRWCYPPRASY